MGQKESRGSPGGAWMARCRDQEPTLRSLHRSKINYCLAIFIPGFYLCQPCGILHTKGCTSFPIQNGPISPPPFFENGYGMTFAMRGGGVSHAISLLTKKTRTRTRTSSRRSAKGLRVFEPPTLSGCLHNEFCHCPEAKLCVRKSVRWL